ncbi:CHASE2 domain-containing protein [Undibacterium sp. TJN19]|uniref:CHASE2 domain-containing protein n=1 Tax=Undibacterium sp. TJN19 TaxID=3413055 RepID=UPI003BF3FF45
MRKNVNKLARWGVGLFFTALAVLQANAFLPITLVDKIDTFIYDTRMKLQPAEFNDAIVIVNIDEKSLKELGQWPWKRIVVANLIEKLTDEYHVKVVGMDAAFPEPDGSSGFQILESLAKKELKDSSGFAEQVARLRNELDFDGKFARSLTGRPVVLGYFLSNDADVISKGLLPTPAFSDADLGGRVIESTSYSKYTANLPQLQDAAIAAGFVNPSPDTDGVIRRIPLLTKVGKNYYEALSLATARVALSASKVKPVFLKADGVNSQDYLDEYGVIEAIKLNSSPNVSIPVEPLLTALIQYKGKGGPRGGGYAYVSAIDVLKKQLPLKTLSDKIVLIGTTAAGIKDLRTAPVGLDYPGVEMHANVIASILSGDFKQRPDTSRAFEVIQVILLGLVLTFVLSRFKAVAAVFFTLATLLLVTGLNYWMYYAMNQVLPLASALLLIAALFTCNIAWGYFIESRKLRGVVRRFGEYVAPELVAVMAEEPDSYTMEGESRELTVMFSDVRGFTTISESLSPVDLREYINIYLTAMSEEIRGNSGTLDKYIGDAVMAFWGAPVRLNDHARLSVLTALNMQVIAKRLSEEFVQRGWPALKIGIGLNTGEMRVGDMGSKIRLAYTVMGDAVNLSSRLEGVTKLYGVGILVGEATKLAAPGFAYRELDRVRVKGKSQPISIFTPLAESSALSREQADALELWHSALACFRAQQWDEAERLFRAYLDQHAADQASQVFLERVEQYRDNPPGEDWDGVTTFASKFSS